MENKCFSAVAEQILQFPQSDIFALLHTWWLMGESTNTFLLKYEKRAESSAERAEVAAEPK